NSRGHLRWPPAAGSLLPEAACFVRRQEPSPQRLAVEARLEVRHANLAGDEKKIDDLGHARIAQIVGDLDPDEVGVTNGAQGRWPAVPARWPRSQVPKAHWWGPPEAGSEVGPRCRGRNEARDAGQAGEACCFPRVHDWPSVSARVGRRYS